MDTRDRGLTTHRVAIADAADLSFLPERSVELVVTSPPYPMIEMWDELFAARRPEIRDALEAGNGWSAFELMHEDLDRVWREAFRVLADGAIACINIGDATRSVADRFRLYPNHARILSRCVEIGFDVLPGILWRKQTNAPNKFMGSGMLPPGAYVTLEHEHILVLRKGAKRAFATAEQKANRQQSAYFWEERNAWFSDLWDLKGTRQALASDEGRARSAAFPFELAYRLVHMYSCRGDVVLDPFAGTGTTMLAALAGARNSIGVELDDTLLPLVRSQIASCREAVNEYIVARVNNHRDFCARRASEKQTGLKHRNDPHDFPVVTGQEKNLLIEAVESVEETASDPDGVTWEASYCPLDRLDGPGPLFGTL
ncbi:MAG: DNA-methyltransferase [Spirochaetota bacterium]